MAGDKLTRSLMENLITILCFDDKNGRMVANLIDVNLCEGEYRVVAERAVDYWGRYGKAPKDHTADLFADIMEDKGNRKAPVYRRILTDMLQLSEGMNDKYVMDQLRDFTRLQSMKDGILKAAEQLNAQQHLAIGDVETMLHELLEARDVQYDPGISMFDITKLIDFLDLQTGEFTTGIKLLDDGNVVPYRGALTTFVAPSGKGKSWWLVHIGKHALLQRKKVLHITLEMAEEQVLQRYVQSIFNVAKRQSKVETAYLDIKDDEVMGVDFRTVRPRFNFRDYDTRMELGTAVMHNPARWNNLRIKRWPPQVLTPQLLEAYLDTLELQENFIPDMVIVDYIGLMKYDYKYQRQQMGLNTQLLRGIGVKRNMSMNTAHQSSREGANSAMVRGTHIAEDWSIIGTSDAVITYSCTDAEFDIGLARLWVEKARGDKDRFGAIITQQYATGQFAVSSARYRAREYRRIVEGLGLKDDAAEGDDD